jgi:phenylacetate-coenzyme A ligase PaaK-like adenylate-forming protein
MHPYQILDGIRLLSAQRMSPEAVQAGQEKKLRALIHQAYHHVPFYRRIMDAHKLKPEDIQNAVDLQRLPLVSRDSLVRATAADITAGNIDLRRCVSPTTSGTSGQPLKVLFRREDWTIMNLTWVRAFLASGMSPRQKRAAFTGRRDSAEERHWYEYLGLWRRKDISTWLDRKAWIDAVRGWKPAALVGYSMTLRVLAEAVRKYGASDVRLKYVFSTAGILDDVTRAILKDVFGAQVIDIYASVEGGCLAWECRVCGGYHLSEDTLIVEILKDGRPARPGESGEVVITNLNSFAMPLIRYRHGDEVTLAGKEPACGRRLKLLAGIQGRVNDCIILKTGERISSQPFFFAVQEVPGVRQWRITQESFDRLQVEIEPTPEFRDSSEHLIIKNLQDLVREQMSITLSLVSSFPFDPDRKFRQVQSKVGSPT